MALGFERGISKDTLGIGQDEVIKKWLNDKGIPENEYSINEDFSITGDIDLSNGNLASFENCPIKIVHGNFWCDNNKLISLEGCSIEEVMGSFSCTNNQLTSLTGAPKTVGDFWCDNNNLISLKGCPKEVGGSFSCTNNPLESLEHLPERDKIKGNFWI